MLFYHALRHLPTLSTTTSFLLMPGLDPLELFTPPLCIPRCPPILPKLRPARNQSLIFLSRSCHKDLAD